MELISGSLQPLSAGSLDVFAGLTGTGAGTGAGCGRDSVPQLVERLRARLGEEAVYGVASIPEHRPEAAWRRVHELSLTSVRRMGEKMTDRGSGDDMPRPVWLLDTPLAISLSDMQEGHRSGLVLEQGPERIESGWWDGRGVARDYYIARQCAGRMPEPTPAGRPQGEGQDGPSQCAGRMPEPTPVGAPEGREPRMGPRQCGGRTPKPTPVGAPEGRGPGTGPRQIRGARPSHGARLWVFQERLSKRWYLHGVFA
jgi:hypothetical protein